MYVVSVPLQVYNSKGIYIEDSDVWGTAPGGWALTYINVQYGHVCRSHIHHADWCFGLTGAPCPGKLDTPDQTLVDAPRPALTYCSQGSLHSHGSASDKCTVMAQRVINAQSWLSE
jgi:hypothetical protein